MLKDKLKNLKKTENLIFLVIILVVTIIFINIILKDDTASSKDEENIIDNTKILANESSDVTDNNLEKNLEKILSTIKGVGEVNVFINYSESSKTIAMYDEKTTISSTEENDSSGGVRNTTSTETQKDVIFSDSNGGKKPVTEKVIMPVIEGAIITAKGASNASVRSNIINATQAATGLGIDKIQVFEMK